jgi:hypothetical protein
MASFLNPLLHGGHFSDPLSLLQQPLLGGQLGGHHAHVSPVLTLNHLALLMSSYQKNLAQHAFQNGLAGGDLDPAVAALLFPGITLPQLSRAEA